MDKYLAAYNDVDDDIDEGKEEIRQESDKEEENTYVVQIDKKDEQITERTEDNAIEENNLEDNEKINADKEERETDEYEVEDKDFVISDDDLDFFRLRKRSREETNDEKQEVKSMLIDAKLSKRSISSRLVSYGEDEDEEEPVDQQDEDIQEQMVEDFVEEGASQVEDQHSHIDEKAADSAQVLKLPPLVATKCSKAMQDKVTFLHKKVTQEGMNLNFSIQGKKNFRNPSIYEKLLEYCRIDEQGTNYPTHLYNPRIFGPESHYKALAEAQNENERKKKEKKKNQSGKKASKWDNPALQTAINNLNSAIFNNNAANNPVSEDASVKKVPSVGSLIKNISS